MKTFLVKSPARALLLSLILSGLSAQEPLKEPNTVSPRLATLKRQLQDGDSGALEKFWQEIAQQGTPLVEPVSGDEKHVLVTFLWREKDPVRNVVIISGLKNWTYGRSVLPDIQMARLPGTDVWFKTYGVRSDARFTYKLSVNDSLIPEEDEQQGDAREAQWQPDPLNPRRVVYPKDQERSDSPEEIESVVELPTAPPQPWIVRTAGILQGEVVLHRFRSTLLGNERRIWVYTPPSYKPGSKPLPLLVLFDGRAYIHNVPVPVILDNLLAADKIIPTIAVLVDNVPGGRRRDLGCNPAFNRFLAEELLPWIRDHRHISTDPKDVIIGGRSRAGLGATCAALEHPELFGNVLSQSGAFLPGAVDTPIEQQLREGWLMEQFSSRPRLPLRFYLDVGIYEIGTPWPSLLLANRHMRDVLRAKGYPLFYQEFVGHHDSINWRGTLPDGLIYLLNSEPETKTGAASREDRHEPKRIILLQPIRLLTSDGRYEDAEPAPSPDGKHVIFSRVEVEGGGRRHLWIVDTSGGPPRPLTPPDFDWDCTRPSWSRDGQWVAFRASREVNDSERGGVWIMPASGGAPRQLTGRSPAEDDYYPQWFPDGRQLAVLRDVPSTESDVWVVGLDGTARRLTAHPAFDGKSTISPEGRWIAFPSERSGARNLWIMPVAEGESEARQFTFDGGRGPAWSRDGRWIAYGCPVLPRGYALCLKRVEGGPVIQVTDGSRNDFNPEWGPDGTWIAVAQGDDDAFGRIAVVDVGAITSAVTRTAGSGGIVFDSERDGHEEVYVMDPDGSNQQRLTHTSGKGSVKANWSPDGTRIAFVSNRDGNWEIYVMNPDGSNVQRLTENESDDIYPTWSPDGKKIAFGSGRDGNLKGYEIYVMDADGSNVHRLTHTSGRGGSSENPDWSPDGKRIAFGSYRDGNWGTYVMEVDGSNVQRLTYTPGKESGNPAWSPDGKRIAFESSRNDNWEIFVMDSDGSNVHRLTGTKGRDKDGENPDWSPNGKKIVFCSARSGKGEENFEIYVMDADGSKCSKAHLQSRMGWTPQLVTTKLSSPGKGFLPGRRIGRELPSPPIEKGTWRFT